MNEKKEGYLKLITIDRLHGLLTSLIRISLIIAIATATINNRYTTLFVATLSFILTFVPYLFKKRYHIYLPVEFEVTVILFIYGSLYLGEVHGYYELYWWWDILLHTSSAIAFGFIGFAILYILYSGKKISGNPAWIAIFSFCFAMAIGCLWEIYEFGMDQLFGFNMQKSGLIDTMWDLIIDGLGALIASISGYFYMKKRHIFLFGRALRKFEEENISFFEDGKKTKQKNK